MSQNCLEIYTEQFSTLHAICEAALKNDDDEEKLRFLLVIIIDDFHMSKKTQNQDTDLYREQSDFARKIDFLINLKLKTFEDFVQLHFIGDEPQHDFDSQEASNSMEINQSFVA